MSDKKKESKEFKEIYNDYMAELIGDGAANEDLREAISRAKTSYRNNLKRSLEAFPESQEYMEKARKIKEYSIDHMEELVEQTMKAVERNHGKAYLAKDAEDANRIISEIIGEDKKTIVKGKSLTTEETHLRQHLQKEGHEVWETDLGEFLVQLKDGRPMHTLAPAVDLKREEASKLISKATGEKISETNIEEMVMAVKKFLRQKYIDSEIGISGANAVAAETGSLFIIENEGNIKLSTALQEKHIALVGVEKIVPTLDDAFHISKTTWRFANYIVPSYVHMISGPSKTGDIEKVITYGAHGPKEFHLVLLDNGRLKVSKDEEFKEILKCQKCGACMYECPVFWVTAGHFGKQYPGGIGVLWDAFVAKDIKEAAPAAFSCALCGRCGVRCPMGIDSSKLIQKLREQMVKKGYTPDTVNDVRKEFFNFDKE
ncbi:MAG: lactate utilization protein B [Acidobacteriota bacterium]